MRKIIKCLTTTLLAREHSMPVRDILVTRLCKEILGPRNGPRELFLGKGDNPPPNPADEYVVGVLEPKGTQRSALAHVTRSFFSNQEVIRMDDSEKIIDEEEDCNCESEPAEITPELDPRALPKSIGLSFVLNGTDQLKISFCITWARYKKVEKAWQRCPDHIIKKNIEIKDELWKSETDSGVIIKLRQRKVLDGIHVSLFLVNVTPTSGQYPQVEELIFQPQIRIKTNENTVIIPIRGEEEQDEQDGLNLLYRNRYAKARGHLCSALWDEVDPERNASVKKTEVGPPFSWVDGETLDPSDRLLFSCPSARTEYLPSYGIEQASLRGPSDGNLCPIPAELLANAYNTVELNMTLEPVINAYELWIERKRQVLTELSEKEKKQANLHLNACESSLKRMKEGLAYLNADTDARLAFCFMNEAMHQQSVWKNAANPLKWHLFQIAFILQCITGIAIDNHPDRSMCDLLWFPTGAGKTEAYLGLASFAIALRRRTALKNQSSKQAGVAVLSRYTLRLLTIQQFRRALSMITACEYLRISSWMPKGEKKTGFPWGTSEISIGLWVGAGVTPNHLIDFKGFDVNRQRPVLYLGAIGELYGRTRLQETKAIRTEGEESEPAQVLNCPCCKTILAISPTTLTDGEHIIHWIISSRVNTIPDITRLPSYRGIKIQEITFSSLPNKLSKIVSVKFTVSPRSQISPETIDSWWKDVLKPSIDSDLVEEFTRPSRPGYFYRRSGFSQQPINFEIHCPNPNCDLNAIEHFKQVRTKSQTVKSKPVFPFTIPEKEGAGWGMPIPAYTVDDQIYGNCPSMIVATVDKFARLSFEPRASSLFGYVTHFDSDWGYYREGVLPYTGDFKLCDSYEVETFVPPCLIIQDELHLIEGPLGTMVGLYETGIEILASQSENGRLISPKYIASTATIKQADSQIQALFNRKLSQFPPSGIDIDDSFFAITHEPHQLESMPPGRLYLGICAPGRGAQTPIIRVWSKILEEMATIRANDKGYKQETDQFSTIVGYFNAKRELAGALGLYKQDIPERLGVLSDRSGHGCYQPREYIELSGRTPSLEIPGKLDHLGRYPDNDIDALFCTSMFGTGVDVDRLGLMIIHGQPKTTANYIQASGRVGRKMGGLVITFLRSTRPRDLDHYEFFVGYHRSLHRYVEPITVYPFSPRARERGLGPLSVMVLRNVHDISGVVLPASWAPEGRPWKTPPLVSGSRIMGPRRRSPEISAIIDRFESRSIAQPKGRNPGKDTCKREIIAELDRWEAFALKNPKELVYYEPTMTREPFLPVVLGDPSHEQRSLPQVYRNSPQSLREVEATTTFDDEV
jgi:hypothetical protein